MSQTAFAGINCVLAVLASAAAFGSLNKMQVGTTRPCLMLAMGLIGIGIGGQALGLVGFILLELGWIAGSVHETWEGWTYYADTALYGGILVLLIASQRVHSWFLERWANPVATVLASIVGLLFLVGMLSGCAVPAQQAPSTDVPAHTFEVDGARMRLLSAPCTDARSSIFIAVSLPQYAERFRAIDSHWRMRDGSERQYAGCWAELSAEEANADQAVMVLVFSDGTAFAIPKSEFAKRRGHTGT